jgi:hypothetical protein
VLGKSSTEVAMGTGPRKCEKTTTFIYGGGMNVSHTFLNLHNILCRALEVSVPHCDSLIRSR